MSDILKTLENTTVNMRKSFISCNRWETGLNDTELYHLIANSEEEIRQLRKRVVDLSWSVNPDRSGGQFTQEELNRGDGW
jgi:hypothetical protein